MEIKIVKNDENLNSFEIEEKLYEFNYENLDMLITRCTSNDDEIQYLCSNEDLLDYKLLLEKIIEGCRTDDFRKALENTKSLVMQTEP